jgi:hypothetical protein
MGISRGNITTNIIKSGLVFNMDAANRASYPKTGTTVTDTINISNTGSLINDVAFNTNPSTFEFGLDGVDDYIDFGPDICTSLGSSVTQLTTSIWFKTDSTAANDGIFAMRPSSTDTTLIGSNTNSNKIYIWCNGSNHYKSVSFTSTSDYNNATIVFVGGSSFDLYLNGVLQSMTTEGGSQQSSINLSTSNLYLGLYYNTSFTFDGNIGNFQVYNRALSASEVLFNYNGLKSRFGL